MHDYKALIDKQRAYLQTAGSLTISNRKQALKKLGDWIRAYEPRIIQALQADLHKSEFEAYSSEVGIVLHEISFALQNLERWARPKKVRTPVTHLGSKSYIHYEPYGVVLIIAPWNFPFQLAINPLIGALAAGNSAIIKPSELTPHTSAIIAELISKAFNPEYVAVVEGGADASSALLAERTDYIFYTGGEAVGKIVMEAAAKHLTPVTLELGGKSPCIVHADANLPLAAKRIAWGKFMNAGQTCVAPDYLYVHESVKEPFLNLLQAAIRQLYGEKPLQNPAYTHIVNQKHYNRLVSLMDNGTIIYGGEHDHASSSIEPTLLADPAPDSSLMQQEIFGPLLPIMTYQDIKSIMIDIKQREKPLSLYLFSQSKNIQQQIISQLPFGGGCINDTVYHFTNPHLPFGGTGNSGMGAYHGKNSFELFSHRKSILKQTTIFDLPFRYPGRKNGLAFIKRFLK
ncbi:aldehyde dehydrogenase [Paenibacillus sp. GXUN7292]|uniref:aldehyde dehydrogenase n=1 Tax=Paenibacillus sp. GXUN7292 TaxID=3422499 RepID=UPI003D7D9EE2